MNISNLNELSKLASEKSIVRKQALYDYLIRFLKADRSELFPEHANLLESMVKDENIDLDVFCIFIQYLLGVNGNV